MKILTTTEVAKRLGISLRRVQQLVQNGRLPATEFGGSYMIRESDIKYVLKRKPGRPRKSIATAKQAMKTKK